MTLVKSSSLIRSSRPSLVMPAFDDEHLAPARAAASIGGEGGVDLGSVDVTSHLHAEQAVGRRRACGR